MKKALLLTCIVTSALVFAACSNNTTAPEEDGSTQAPVVEMEPEALPPVDETVQALYEGATDIYTNISLGQLPVDREQVYEVGDYTYYKVTDSRFADYEAFRTYLAQYFTLSFIDDEILNENNLLLAKGEDGMLYSLGSGRGTNIFYAGHTFEISHETEQEIGLKATAYYTNSATPEEEIEYFYTTPENTEDYTTQTYSFSLLKEDGAWRFDTFHLFY